MSARRIQRVLELREKDLDRARAALEAATTRTLEATISVDQERAESVRAQNAVAALECASAGDLVVASAHIDSCHRRIVAALQRLREAQAAEANARAKTNEARIKVRQIELWRETMKAREATAMDVEERKMQDALAARGFRGDSR